MLFHREYFRRASMPEGSNSESNLKFAKALSLFEGPVVRPSGAGGKASIGDNLRQNLSSVGFFLPRLSGKRRSKATTSRKADSAGSALNRTSIPAGSTPDYPPASQARGQQRSCACRFPIPEFRQKRPTPAPGVFAAFPARLHASPASRRRPRDSERRKRGTAGLTSGSAPCARGHRSASSR